MSNINNSMKFPKLMITTLCRFPINGFQHRRMGMEEFGELRKLLFLFLIISMVFIVQKSQAQSPLLGKNNMVVGIRAYSSFMRTFKKSDTTFLKHGIGANVGYFHNLNKRGSLFGIISLGYDNFWTYKSKNLNSVNLSYDAYALFRRFMIDLSVGERYFINNKRRDRLHDFEFEFGGGLLYNFGSLFRNPLVNNMDVGIHYRQIGRNKMWYLSMFYCLPFNK